MSYHFEFETQHRILRACLEGVIGDEEVHRFRAEMAGLVAEGRPSGCIVDLSDMQKYDISSASIRVLGKSSPAVPGITIPVIVVAPAAHMFGLTRMFQITSEETRPWLRVVKSCDEAYKSLRVTAPRFVPLPEDLEERKKMWAIP